MLLIGPYEDAVVVDLRATGGDGGLINRIYRIRMPRFAEFGKSKRMIPPYIQIRKKHIDVQTKEHNGWLYVSMK